MSDAIKLTATSDARQFVAALDQMQKKIVELEGQLQKASSTSKRLTSEQKTLAREAKQVFDSVRSPLEQHNARLAKYNTLLEKGKIDGETWGRAFVRSTAMMNAELAKLNKKTAEQIELERNASQRQRQFANAAKDAWERSRTPLQRYHRELGNLQYLQAKGFIGQNTYNAAVAHAEKEYVKAANAGKKAFGSEALSMVRSLTYAIGIGGGLYQAINLVKEEFNALLDRYARAKDITRGTSGSQIAAIRNLGAESQDEVTAFTAQIAAMSQDVGLKPEDLYARASDALSARGYLSVDTAMQAVRASARIAPESMEIGKPLAGAALDIAKIEKGITPEQAIGFVMDVGKMARITDTGMIAEHIAPALTSAMANDASLASGGALFAAITQGMADPVGRRSGTAATNLVTKLREFLPNVATFDERLEMIQNDERLRAEFLRTNTFEVKAQTPIEQLLAGKGATAEAYADFRRRTLQPTEAGEYFEQQVKLISEVPEQRTAALDRKVQATKANLQLSNQEAARVGVMLESFQETLEDSGMSRTAAKLRQFAAVTTEHGRPEEQMQKMIEILEAQRQYLLRETTTRPLSLSAPFGGAVETVPHIVSPQEREKADILKGLIDFAQRESAGGSSSSLEEKTDLQTRVLEDMSATLRDIRANTGGQDNDLLLPGVNVIRVPAIPTPSGSSVSNTVHSE